MANKDYGSQVQESVNEAFNGKPKPKTLGEQYAEEHPEGPPSKKKSAQAASQEAPPVVDSGYSPGASSTEEMNAAPLGSGYSHTSMADIQ